MATQVERRKQTRRRLLDAGTAVLLDQGAAGFSTVAVAEAAELSNGAVFNHFSTRLDLLTATVEYALAELREGFAQEFSVVGADASAAELLTILWICMKRPEQVAVTEVFALARTNPELQESLTPIVQEHHQQIKNMLSLLAGAQVETADKRSNTRTRTDHKLSPEIDRDTQIDTDSGSDADAVGSGPTSPLGRGRHGITAEFVESVSFLFIYAMVGLTINNAVGAGIGSEAEFVRLGQQMFSAVESQGSGG